MRIAFELLGGGTVYLFRSLTRTVCSWVEDHLPAGAMRIATQSPSSGATSETSLAARSLTDFRCSNDRPEGLPWPAA
jgi:hypothetical protein